MAATAKRARSKKKKAPPKKKPVPEKAARLRTEKIRVLIAKPGLDGHDRGAKIIARALRDAGFEVVYLGVHQTPEMVVNAAIDEDVQVVGLSVLSGAHNALVPDVIAGLKKAGLKDILYLVGGIIPEEDFPFLKKKGVDMIFTPGASLADIIDYIRVHAPTRG